MTKKAKGRREGALFHQHLKISLQEADLRTAVRFEAGLMMPFVFVLAAARLAGFLASPSFVISAAAGACVLAAAARFARGFTSLPF